MRTIEERVAEIEARIEGVRERREPHKEALKRLAARERRMLAEVAALRADPKPTSRRKPRSGADPHVQAGRYVGLTLDAFKKARRPLSQREAGLRGGAGRGTLTHAIKALKQDGLIEPTGERDGRSMVYRLTDKGRAGRAVTRRKPGE